MRPKSIVLVLLAVGCGLVASIGVSQFLEARGKPADQGDKQAVFVALTDIAPNEEFTAQNIKLEEWPKNIVPAGALTKIEEVEGKRSRMKLYVGEPILASKLVGEGEATGAAKDIPAGFRVTHVKVDSVTGSSNLILPGDRVDVLVFRNTNSDLNATAARIVLQDIKVFAVDTHTETEYAQSKADQNEAMTAKSIALLVTPEQSLILHTAQEISGSLRLVLRNPTDEAHVNAAAVSIGDIFGPEIRSNRRSEKGTEKEKGDITAWLTQQKEQDGGQGSQPPSPPLPARRKMIVMLGSEISEVEFPGDGQLPTQPVKTGSTNSATQSGVSQLPGNSQPGDMPLQSPPDEQTGTTDQY